MGRVGWRRGHRLSAPDIIGPGRCLSGISSSAVSAAASFFSGWRLMPEMMPATSQLDWHVDMVESDTKR